MLNKIKYGFVLAAVLFSASIFAQDYVADNMLAYQRSVGGWPKHIGETKIDYTKTKPMLLVQHCFNLSS